MIPPSPPRPERFFETSAYNGKKFSLLTLRIYLVPVPMFFEMDICMNHSDFIMTKMPPFSQPQGRFSIDIMLFIEAIDRKSRDFDDSGDNHGRIEIAVNAVILARALNPEYVTSYTVKGQSLLWSKIIKRRYYIQKGH